ncbi:MAG: cytochrome C [Rickettsiales bacterium]|nr:cytochrome C [Rickettsiales bacterium]|tara:strand:+ start:3285 stop:3644 length:360 start_codon:yes stop_codon:yes gene_type:complete
MTRLPLSVSLMVLFGLVVLLPATGRAADDGAGLYKTYCVTCHGETGKGDGVAGAALNPKPADLSKEEFWKSRDDAAIKKVIKEGGAAVGKSPLMVAWGAVLDDAKIEAVLKHLKTFKGK